MSILGYIHGGGFGVGVLAVSVLHHHLPRQGCGQVQEDLSLSRTTPKGELQISYKSAAVSQGISHYGGFQKLISNGITIHWKLCGSTAIR